MNNVVKTVAITFAIGFIGGIATLVAGTVYSLAQARVHRKRVTLQQIVTQGTTMSAENLVGYHQ